MGRSTHFAVVLVALAVATAVWPAVTTAGGPGHGRRQAEGPAAPAWSRVDDFAFQLENVSLRALGRSRFDLVIIDYSRDGSEATRWSAARIARLRASPGGPKRVLAYLSIGEAEDYRWYWRQAWDADRDGTPDAGAPAWLGEVNPDWRGCYKVRYWDPGWRALLFGSADAYVDKIVAAGFDGVYLDVVDGYEYWGPDGVGELDAATAEQKMVDLVRDLAAYARTLSGRPGFGVFPQNGVDLGRRPEYVEAVTGIGAEDTWYDGARRQPFEETAYVVRGLRRFRAAGKLVLCTDYCRRPAAVARVYRRARVNGFVPCVTVRALDRLTINPGWLPD